MIFPDWVPVTDGFGYTGEANSLTYSGRWIAPYTVNNLQLARELVDPKKRYAAIKNKAATYDYKQQIEHNLINQLTAQKMSIKPLGSYAPNALANGTSVDLNSGLNVLQNVSVCEISVEWMLEPRNYLGINCATVMIRGESEFVELGESSTIAAQYDYSGLAGRSGDPLVTANLPTIKGNYRPISRPHVRVDSKDEITIEYPWVESSLVNLSAMAQLRGCLNLKDIAIWAAGTLLYVCSDIEESVSPMGHEGFKVTHKLQSKPQDWNLIDAPIDIPPLHSPREYYPAATSERLAWSQIGPKITANGTLDPASTVRNDYTFRSYKYENMQDTLFFYGISGKAGAPPVVVNP